VIIGWTDEVLVSRSYNRLWWDLGAGMPQEKHIEKGCQ